MKVSYSKKLSPSLQHTFHFRFNSYLITEIASRTCCCTVRCFAGPESHTASLANEP